MTRIYQPHTDQRPCDPALLAALGRLPDDYWAFVHLELARPVDCLLIREVPAAEAECRRSAIRCVTVQRPEQQLRGTVHDPWSSLTRDGQWQPLPPLPDGASNYFQQALRAADAARDWLHNRQRLFLAGEEALPLGAFRVWPDLLLLSPDGGAHRLPISPTPVPGSWFFSVEQWLTHLHGWEPRQGRAFTGTELAALAAELLLVPLSEAEQPMVAAAPAAAAEVPAERLALRTDDLPEEVWAFARWLQRLEVRIARLEAQGSTGEPIADARTASVVLRNGHLPTAAEAQGSAPAPRGWHAAERTALVRALEDLRRRGGNRTLPSVLEQMNQQLGYRLKEQNYNGYGSARAMLEQARLEGLVVYGPENGGNPTLYLPSEPLPSPTRK